MDIITFPDYSVLLTDFFKLCVDCKQLIYLYKLCLIYKYDSDQ